VVGDLVLFAMDVTGNGLIKVNVLFGIAPKEPKKSSPLKPIRPRKPKFPAGVVGGKDKGIAVIVDACS
jgi:hypothetical protein